jgi:hypothetical protein
VIIVIYITAILGKRKRQSVAEKDSLDVLCKGQTG